MKIFFYEINLVIFRAKSFISFLSCEEQKRIVFYLDPKHQSLFIIRRGILRSLLGKYLEIPPKKVLIQIDSRGKPYTRDIFFNMSSSKEKLLIALSWEIPLGIDIEYTDVKNWSFDAEDFIFSENEKKMASNLCSKARTEYFFTVWTKKESWVKATGSGLNMDLKSLDTEGSLQSHFTAFSVEKPYVAHLAVENNPLMNISLDRKCFSV